MGKHFTGIFQFLNSSKECSVFFVCIQPRWICDRYFWRSFAAQRPVLFFSNTQRLGDLILKHIFATWICIDRSGFFSGPSVWVTTNQRTYKSEPVMARARWEKESKRIIIVKCNFWMRPVTNVWTIVQRVRSGEERNSQGDRVPEEVGCHRQRRLFNTNLSF